MVNAMVKDMLSEVELQEVNKEKEAGKKQPKESKPEDHRSCIAHLIAEDISKSAVIEEKTFKHSPWAGADNPLGPKF